MTATLRRRALLGVGVLGVVVLGGSAAAGADAPIASAAPTAVAVHAPPVAGWVAYAPRVRDVAVTVVVPGLDCHGSRATAVTVGIFGSIRQGSAVTPWQLAVVASCHRGDAHYVAIDRDARDIIDRVAVRAGDRVRLIKATASGYEIDNLTQGSGTGGGSVGSGPQPRLVNPVVFGGVERGPGHPSLHVHFTNARLDRTSLERLDPHRQRQVVDRKVIAEPRAIQRGGTFGIVINP